MSKSEKQLCRLYSELSASDQATLLAFAQFLHARAPREIPPAAPQPRPQQESVVGAIKRLSAGYPMLDKSKILHETSALMSQHVLQGRDAKEVIDELEGMFLRYYEEWKADQG